MGINNSYIQLSNFFNSPPTSNRGRRGKSFGGSCRRRCRCFRLVVEEALCKDLESRGLITDAGRRAIKKVLIISLFLSLCHGSDGHANEAAGRSHFA